MLPEALSGALGRAPPARSLPVVEPQLDPPERALQLTLGTLTSSLTTLPAATALLLSHLTVHACKFLIRGAGGLDWCSASILRD